MKLPLIPPPCDKISEMVVLGLIALGVMALCAQAIYKGAAGDSAAWSAVLMAIINTIKEGRAQRSADRTVQALTPQSNGATA